MFKGTKRVEVGEGKRIIEVLNIKVATKHKNWVFHLLCRASEHDMLPYASKFMPASLHPKSQQYPGVMNGHLNFVKDMRLIPIVGLSQEAAQHTKPDADYIPITYLDHIIKKMNANTIQPTSRTGDIGKWIVVTKSENQEKTQQYIDKEMPRTFMKDIPAETLLPGFPHPRRTHIPLDSKVLGTYAETINQMAQQGAALPQVTVKNPWKKPKEVFLARDEQQFPELQRTTAGRNQKQTTPKVQVAEQTTNTIQQKLKQMEKEQEQKLQAAEKKHKKELEEVMESFKRQQDQAIESMEKQIPTSH